MLRVGELTEQGMLTAPIRPRNALRLKGLVPLLLSLARDGRRRRVFDLQPTDDATGPVGRTEAL
jgi:hypothetical protein